MTLFVQKCQNFAAFSILSFIPPPFPPQKGGTCFLSWGPNNPFLLAKIWLIPVPVTDHL